MEVKTVLVERQIFVADDGKEFDTEAACLKHERDKADAALRREYAATLREMQKLKRRDGRFSTFSLAHRNAELTLRRNEYRHACSNGVEGTLAERLSYMSTLCSNYANAISRLENAQETYRLLKQRLNEIGEKLGYRIPTRRKMQERSLAALSCKNSGTDVK